MLQRRKTNLWGMFWHLEQNIYFSLSVTEKMMDLLIFY